MATGKISRLPREICEQLNRRLDNGTPGSRPVTWVNELPPVRAGAGAEKRREWRGIRLNWGQSRLIKVINLKKVGALRPRRDGARRSKLAGQRPALPVVGAQIDGNKTRLKPIKVNQGDKFKKGEVQTKLVGCSPSPVSSPSGRGDGLARFWIQESLTTPATVGEARTEGNKAELKPIKVNQGEIFFCRAGRSRAIRLRRCGYGGITAVAGQAGDEATW